MVDTSKLVPQGGQWVKPDMVDSLGKTAREKGIELLFTIVPDSGVQEKEFTEATPTGTVVKKVVKPWITVEFDGKQYKWELTHTANQILGMELGFETDYWVGAIVKPFVDVIAGKRTVKALVISKPRKK